MENKAKGGDIEGKSHEEGGEPLIDEHTGEQVAEVEGGEFINCKEAMDDPTVRTFTGTNKEIVSQVNLTAACNPADDYKTKNENIMKNGGNINIPDYAESEEAFMKYAYKEIDSFLLKTIGEDLTLDWNFHYNKRFYQIEKYITYTRGHTTKMVSARFLIIDSMGKEVGEIIYEPDKEVNRFIAKSELFNWNNEKFAKGGDVGMPDEDYTDMPKDSTEYLIDMSLKPLIEMVRNKAYEPDYRNKISDQEVLGLIVSKYSRWDFNQIQEVCVSAMEDANFREEAGKVSKMQEGGDVKEGKYKIQYPKKGQLPEKFGEALDILRDVGSDLWFKKTPQHKEFYKAYQDLSAIYTHRDVQEMQQGGSVKKPKFKYNVGQEGMFKGEEVEILGLKYSPPLYAIGEAGELFDANIRKISRKEFEDNFSPFPKKSMQKGREMGARDIDIGNPKEAIKMLKADLKGLKTANMQEGDDVKGKYVAVGVRTYPKGEKYYVVVSKPVSKVKAEQASKSVLLPENETGAVMLVSELKKKPHVIGREYLAKGGDVDYKRGKVLYKKGDELYFYDRDNGRRTLTKAKIKMIVSDEEGWMRYLVEVIEGDNIGYKKVIYQNKLFKKGKAKLKPKSKLKPKHKLNVKSIDIDNPDKEIARLKKELKYI